MKDHPKDDDYLVRPQHEEDAASDRRDAIVVVGVLIFAILVVAGMTAVAVLGFFER